MGRWFHFVLYVSFFCVCIGFAALGGFCFRRHTERKKQLQIMAEFESKITGALSVQDHLYTGAGTNGHEAIEGQTLAILCLDRLGIKVSVAEGVENDTLRISAGHFPSTDMPGKGNFAVAGHSSMVYTCLFNDMHKAVKGDVITVTTRGGKHQYVITEIATAEATAVGVLEGTNESIITIVTCTNSGKERLIVRGIEV